MVRLNDDGSVLADNPFIGNANANDTIWSYGHRNIQGMTIDPATNHVWSTEHGSRGGDELNLMQAGENYGWPEVSYSDEYSGGRVAEVSSRPDVPEPKVVWTSFIAPSGLAFYASDRALQLQAESIEYNALELIKNKAQCDKRLKHLNETVRSLLFTSLT